MGSIPSASTKGGLEMTIEEAQEEVAQLWCLPAHADKEMDSELAEDMAQLLSKRTSGDREVFRADCEKIAGEGR